MTTIKHHTRQLFLAILASIVWLGGMYAVGYVPWYLIEGQYQEDEP